MTAPAVAVVGASGFLGRAVVAALDSGGVPVEPYTRSRPFSAGARVDPGIAGARAVVWLATSVNPQLAEQEPSRVAADARTFATLLDGLAALPAPPRVVLLSSGGTVYDPAARPPYAETAPVAPAGAYGRAKLALEEALRGSGLPGVALRVANAYGPGQPARAGQGVVAYWLRAALDGHAPVIYGEPTTTRDYVYVGDVAEAVVRAATVPGEVPPVVNVGSGRPTSLADLARVVLDVTGRPDVEPGHEPRRSFDVPHTWLAVDLAAAALGWRPRTPLREGVAAAWAALPPP